MLVYLAAPYSNQADKDALMNTVMKVSGEYMLSNQNATVVSPLFNHFSLDSVPDLGKDYAFWKRYSIDLLRHCEKMIVLQLPGWEDSIGVQDEIHNATSLGISITYITVE